jgi:hypothetical protein
LKHLHNGGEACTFCVRHYTRLTLIPATKEGTMAKGQMRSNKEKKKPKQNKDKKKDGPAPSPFAAGQQGQSKPGFKPK